MNYEEMLKSREGFQSNRAELPFGTFYRKKIEGKYRSVIELSAVVSDDAAFCRCLRRDCELNSELDAAYQLHYSLNADSNGIYEIELSTGTLFTFRQLIEQTPAVLTQEDFFAKFFSRIFDAAELLHRHHLLQLDFSPDSIFVDKTGLQPRLLLHGSSFTRDVSREKFYGGHEDFMAPELSEGEAVDARSDVYSIGRLIAWIGETAQLPLEYRRIVKRATDERPEKRYASIGEMRDALSKTRSMKNSIIVTVAALLIAMLALWIYFEMLPQTDEVEFVQPLPKENADELLDAELDSLMGIDVDDTDSVAAYDGASSDNMRRLEQIFRRNYAREADKILSKVYNKDYMGSSEKAFLAGSKTMAEELMAVQLRLAEESGISEAAARKIADEEIKRITRQKQSEMKQ